MREESGVREGGRVGEVTGDTVSLVKMCGRRRREVVNSPMIIIMMNFKTFFFTKKISQSDTNTFSRVKTSS